jgi:asparagine N-glycosylation enzyme membrane subunit Stt3
MRDPLRYYAQFQSARGGWTTLPPWARNVVGLFAIPGLVLVLLSILALGVSILALLLLTVPVYRVLQALTGTRTPAATSVDPAVNPFASVFGAPPAGRRHVEARVVDDAPTTTD